ncbi:FecR family protein [Proteiniphilum sp. UBA5384]|uniref:FecR family protein n=1 Tax=Proteiniphilum sp. UBA5384 TaxID=1947279 RepID=UPI0025D0C690|nr:FecR domain-containing protein [Proteiniphilum sp. UBA5384]
MNNDVSQIIIRVLRGNQTEEDMQVFLQWYRASSENKTLFLQLKHIYDLRRGGLNPDETEVLESWDRLVVKLKKRSSGTLLPTASNRHFPGIVKFLGAAAVAVILVIAGIQFFRTGDGSVEWIEVTTGIGSQSKTVILADGSVVRLNVSSSLRYPEKFNTANREVYLDGEAYFNITEDKARTFVVHTDKQSISVLGTEFNVSGYSSDPYTVTTLVTGKVKLDIYDGENNLKNEVMMEPDQQVYFDKEFLRMTLSEVNARDVTSWMEGIYSFRDAPLEEITRRFEKIYGVTIFIPDEADRQEKYTGKFFAYQDIREVMDVLNFKGQFRLQFHADTILIEKR